MHFTVERVLVSEFGGAIKRENEKSNNFRQVVAASLDCSSSAANRSDL